MTIQIFSETPDLSFGRQAVHPATIYDYAGDGNEQRAANQDRAHWRYTWPMRRTATEIAVIDAFFVARSQVVQSFFVTDPWGYTRSGISLGTSTAGQTVFKLPTTGQYAGDFPVDDAHVVVKDDGAAVTVSDTDTEDREFTLAAAPATGSVMTCDYYYYRLVRLLAPFQWAGLGPAFGEAAPEFKEVVE